MASTPHKREDPSQSSLTLDPAVLSSGFESDGQDNITDGGQGLFLVYIPDEWRTQAYLMKRSAEPNLEQQLDQFLQDCE